MSVLETPRLYFKGQISWDPVTTNNYDTNYNEDTAWTILDGAANQVENFRQSAIDQVVTNRSWDPHGTYRSSFYDTAINGFDLGTGLATDDPVVSNNTTGKFIGMLVDTEPYGALSSQLFFDTFEFGVNGGYRIAAPRRFRMTDRYINFGRNIAKPGPIIAGIASAVWQTCFAKEDGLTIDAFDSPALAALNQALQDDTVLGLMVRFNTYRTVYYDDPTLVNDGDGPSSQQLAALANNLKNKLEQGGFQPNPARSKLVGTIGLWRRNEAIHEPSDRTLIQVTEAGKTAAMGSAFAKVNETTLTLDLSNSVPEVDLDCTKLDLGTLLVQVTPSASTPVTVAEIPYGLYDKTAYEASAGLVTVPVTEEGKALLNNHEITITAGTAGPQVVESPIRAISDSPNLYLDAGQEKTPRYQLYYRGQPLQQELDVVVSTMSADGSTLIASSFARTDATGGLTLNVAGTTGTIYAYVVAPRYAPLPVNGIDTQVDTYMYVRVLPSDQDLETMAPTWANVYTHVLMNWDAMAPCMDNWLLLDDPVQVHRYGPVLRRLIDPNHFEHFRFMPVTRDMTPGQRSLLLRFLDGPAPTAADAAPDAVIDKRAPRRAKRGGPSRASRRP